MLEPAEKPVVDLHKIDISKEIFEVLKSHGIESTKAAEDLADLFCFPPPWAPWVK
ncbi:hypothetical protein FDI95_gp022 [Citrobacter phage CF1 ERZ-2017]|uniref:Uncharacterized protein n=1 Tax=Citrobacter phage CF1 ERZ-2017 TaxID=2267236 RepID=A0A2H4YFY9_9CAUD|nr:hypothetical protein FDI95_gp022 [Citrobacter phage CF1 ERZ-2017]AUE22895.1 hypothetical protein Cf1_00022 [Citrobacter phage CF1 ERZ-2017]